MNIALIIPNTTPVPATKGGATENMMNLLIDVNEIEKRHHFLLFCSYEDEAYKLSKKYRETDFYYYKSGKYDHIRELPSRVIRKLTLEHRDIRTNYIRYCADIINEQQVDIVIVEGHCFSIQQLRKLIGDKTLVLHMHIDRLNKELMSSHRIISSCDALIAISEFCKGRMLDVVPDYSDKIYVLKNTIDTGHFSAKGRKDKILEVYRNLGIKPWQNVVYYCGRIVPDKGVLELVKAIGKLQDDDIHLLIIGSSVYQDGKTTPYIEEVSRSGGQLRNGIIFTGYVSQKELPNYIAGATLAVVPSKWLEAAGNVTIEALSCDVPVVASSQGGIPEYADSSACSIVKYDENFIDNLASQIHELLTNKKKYADMKEHARGIAIQYDKNHYYENFCKIVAKITKK